MHLLIAIALLLQDSDKPAESPWSFSHRDGVRYTSPPWRLHAGGVLAVDLYKYDERNVRDSGPALGRAVVRLEAWRGEEWSARIAPDLHGIDTEYGFEEAWVSWVPSFVPSRLLRVTAGLQRIALAIETSIPEEDLPFVGYSVLDPMAARTDLALRFDGEWRDGIVSYQVDLAAGVAYDPQGRKREGPQYSARVMAYPFRWLDWRVLPGLFINLAAFWNPDFEGEYDVTTPLRNTAFTVKTLHADRFEGFHLGIGMEWGPFRLIHENLRAGFVDLEGGGDRNFRNELHGWTASLTVLFTGESYDSRPYRLRDGRGAGFPKCPLDGDGESQGIGAIEAGVRYSNGDIARELFEAGFTDDRTSSQEFRSFSAVVSWYPTSWLRASLEFVRMLLDDDPAEFGGQGRDNSWVFRIQYDF